MIKFLLNGLLRDRHRSLFPLITVSLGVILTIVLSCWINGAFDDMTDFNAKFVTGHVRIMTAAYSENEDQIPNDLALTEADNLMKNLRKDYSHMNWVERIKFAGLLDMPDEKGETETQGPTLGMAVDLLSENSGEIERLNIEESIIRGNLPQKSGEILISDEFAKKLNIKPGDVVTLISSTMHKSMAIYNFTVAGTINFGTIVMNKSSIIVDIKDAQYVLDMENAVSEILGYFINTRYNDEKAKVVTEDFNNKNYNADDEFSPKMVRLQEYPSLKEYLEYGEGMAGVMIFIFVLVMSIVLWNSGLLGGIRRYGEIGVRLAIGENKGHVYRYMIYESIVIGIVGTIIGSCIGLFFAFILSKGIDFGSMMRESTMMMPTEIHAKITAGSYYIGFIPGLLSTVLGTALSGIGIFKRNTAQLFKELET